MIYGEPAQNSDVASGDLYQPLSGDFLNLCEIIYHKIIC